MRRFHRESTDILQKSPGCWGQCTLSQHGCTHGAFIRIHPQSWVTMGGKLWLNPQRSYRHHRYVHLAQTDFMLVKDPPKNIQEWPIETVQHLVFSRRSLATKPGPKKSQKISALSGWSSTFRSSKSAYRFATIFFDLFPTSWSFPSIFELSSILFSLIFHMFHIFPIVFVGLSMANARVFPPFCCGSLRPIHQRQGASVRQDRSGRCVWRQQNWGALCGGTSRQWGGPGVGWLVVLGMIISVKCW